VASSFVASLGADAESSSESFLPSSFVREQLESSRAKPPFVVGLGGDSESSSESSIVASSFVASLGADAEASSESSLPSSFVREQLESSRAEPPFVVGLGGD